MDRGLEMCNFEVNPELFCEMCNCHIPNLDSENSMFLNWLDGENQHQSCAVFFCDSQCMEAFNS